MPDDKLAIYQPREVAIADMLQMAKAFSASGLFGVKTPEQAMALMLIAQAEGLHPAAAARDYDIINGRPAKKSEAMLRSFIQSGGSIKWHELTDAKAEATFTHPQGGTIKLDWTTDRAKRAGLTDKKNRDGSDNMWTKYPRQMLRARVISEGVRTICPSATGGMYVPEEMDGWGEMSTRARRGRGGVSFKDPEPEAIELKPEEPKGGNHETEVINPFPPQSTKPQVSEDKGSAEGTGASGGDALAVFIAIEACTTLLELDELGMKITLTGDDLATAKKLFAAKTKQIKAELKNQPPDPGKWI